MGDEKREFSIPQLSNDSNPIIAQLISRYRSNKTSWSLQDIYEQEDMMNSQSNFALFSQDPIYFEDAIKEEQWINAMNNEIESIEKKWYMGNSWFA